MISTYRGILMIWLLVASFVSRSQSFDGGMYVGLTSNQIDGDGLGGFNHTGVTIGFYTERAFAEKWTGRLELAYIWRGSRELESDTSNFYRTDLHQITLPLLAEYHFTSKISAEIGISGDLNIIATEENIYGDFEPEPPYADASLSGLFGVSYAVTETITIGMRSSYSLTPIRSTRIIQRPPGVFNDWITGSRAVSLSLAVYFTL